MLPNQNQLPMGVSVSAPQRMLPQGAPSTSPTPMMQPGFGGQGMPPQFQPQTFPQATPQTMPQQGALQQVANASNGGLTPQMMNVPNLQNNIQALIQSLQQKQQPQQSMSPLQMMRKTGTNPMTGRKTQARTVDPQEMQRRMQQMQAFKAAHSKG